MTCSSLELEVWVKHDSPTSSPLEVKGVPGMRQNSSSSAPTPRSSVAPRVHSKTAARFSIGQISARTNVAASALRYYEKEGLIPEPHRVGGKRRYSEDVLARVALIQIAQDAGFSLREIKVLLTGVKGEKRGKKALATLAEAKLVEIDETMKRLRLLQRLLTAASSCACPDLDACGAAARRAGLIRPAG